MMLPNGEIKISKMTPDDLRNLIETGEGTFLEFKKTVPSLKKISREIAAFANTKGGTLLVGVDDNGQITGINSYFEEEYELYKAVNEFCIPPVPLHVEMIHAGTHDVMLVRIAEAEEKPVYIKNDKKRLVFIRENDESVQASDELAEILKMRTQKSGVTFEYSENEQMLFRYLNEYGEITVTKYSQLINVTTYRASKILVNLVSAGVLELFRKQKKDYFTFANITR